MICRTKMALHIPICLFLIVIFSCSKDRNSIQSKNQDTVSFEHDVMFNKLPTDTIISQPYFDVELINPIQLTADEFGTTWTKEIDSNFRIISDTINKRFLIYKDKKIWKRHEQIKCFIITNESSRSYQFFSNDQIFATVNTLGLWEENPTQRMIYHIDNKTMIMSGIKNLTFLKYTRQLN